MGKINKVAVYGMGKSGKSALKLALKKGHEVYAVSKGDVSDWYEREGLKEILDQQLCFSEEAFAHHFHDMDLIIISPGIPTSHPALKMAVDQKVRIISEIEFAYQEVSQVPVIAVTGTNGKTTTTTMIAEALRLAGKTVFCGGNIGVPYCDLALSGETPDFAVIEVSSFQLENIETFHPRVGLILNIFPNHSERYTLVEDYALAKFRLLANMTAEDTLILGTENPYLEKIRGHGARHSYFTTGDLPSEFKKKFSFQNARVKGQHNEANFYAAYEALRSAGLEGIDERFQSFIDEFGGVAHRLEYVLSYEGLKIYNDAKSTNTLATTTAIKAFVDDEENLYLILGGKLRSESDQVLPDLLPFKEKIKTIFTIGDVAKRLERELGAEFEVEVVGDLKNLFSLLRERKLEGNLIFSPAHPSFDQFSSYVHRGECFKEWARDILR